MASYYLIELVHFSVGYTSGQIGLAVFEAVALTIMFLVQAARSAARDLQLANDELERRVAERTRELAEATASLQAEMETRKATQDQLRQAQKMEAVRQVTGGIAHGFNNMPAVIVGSFETALRRLAWGSMDVGGAIHQALDGAHRAAGLTRRLLAFSRQQSLAPVVLDVNALVQGMTELLRRSIGERVELECVLAGGLWHAHVDPGRDTGRRRRLPIAGRSWPGRRLRTAPP